MSYLIPAASHRIYYRYRLKIEYLGTGLVGWQCQNNGLSVQQIIEDAIFRFSKERAVVFGAGRTDAGVHALGQVAHFDLSRQYDPYRVMYAINHFVKPYLIGIIDCTIVEPDFHARFSAKARHYLYRIVNRPAKVAIDRERVWWIAQKLNFKAMQEGSKYLVGTHDFTSFRAKHCQAKSPIKTLSSLELTKNNDEINFHLSAPSFLHHMVRNIVGSLVLIGLNKWQPIDIKIALDRKNRAAAGITAPALGLYFIKVDY